MDDIAIIDIDLKKTTWSRVHSSMRTLYLRLSAEPDLVWIRLFREERESRIVARRHGLWIEEGYIVFDCLLVDVDVHHLPDFRRSIDYANARYRELKAASRERSKQQYIDASAEKKMLARLRQGVRENAPRAPEQPRLVAAATGKASATPPRNGADGSPAEFDVRRNELRARFRAALRARSAEPGDGGD